MKIKKFPQSCLLYTSNKTRLLIDPGCVKYEEKFLEDWKTADAVLVTHRHSDHLNANALKQLNLPIYTTKEVASCIPELKTNIIKAGDTLSIGNLKISVVKAIHGYMLAEGEIKENVGFVIDDGKETLYITSDTIRFKNEIKADVIFADVTAFDASMNLWGASQTTRDVGAKLLIVAHQDAGKMLYDKEQIETYLSKENINFKIPKICEEFEI